VQFIGGRASVTGVDQDRFAGGQLYQLRVALTDIQKVNYKFPRNWTRLRLIVPYASEANDRNDRGCGQRYDEDRSESFIHPGRVQLRGQIASCNRAPSSLSVFVRAADVTGIG